LNPALFREALMDKHREVMPHRRFSADVCPLPYLPLCAPNIIERSARRLEMAGRTNEGGRSLDQ